MTAAAFNPYHEWLGLDPSLERPDYFQLLGLDEAEDRLDVITSAADRALSRVRGFRPGAHAAQWAAVLDQISAAKKCLTNEASRAEYRREREAARRGPAERTGENVTVSWGATSGAALMSTNSPYSPTPAPNPAPMAPSSAAMGAAVSPSMSPSSAPVNGGLGAAGSAWGGNGAGAAWPTASAWPNSGLPTTPGAIPATTPTAGPAWGSAWGTPAGVPNPMAPVVPSYGPTNTAPSAAPSMPASGTAWPNYSSTPYGATPSPQVSGLPMGMGPGSPLSPSPMSPMSPSPMSPMAPAPQAYGTAFANPPLAANPYGSSYPTVGQTPMAPGAPLAGGYPYAAPMATPVAAPMAAPLAMPVASGSPLLAAPTVHSPLGGGVLGGTDPHMAAGQLLVPDEAIPGSVEPPRVRSANLSRAVLAQQQARGAQTPLILAIGAAIVLILGGVLFVVMNDESEQLAAKAPNVPVAPTKNLPTSLSADSSDRDSESGGNRRGKGGPKSGTRPPKTTVAIGKADSLPDGDPAMNTSPTGNDSKKNSPSKGDSSEDGSGGPAKPETKAEMKPEMPATPGDDSKPESKPEPKPEAKLEPAPKPEPTPEPKPEPKPVPRPSKEELSALARALETARTAIGEQQYEVAKLEIEKAAAIAKVPAHVARVERLKALNHYCQEFRAALRDAVKNLKAGEAITVKTTTVGIVETFSGQDKIILRVAGMNRTYQFDQLPIGLAVAIADMWLDKTQASSLVIKASYVGAHKSATDEMKGKAREWLDEAQGKLPEVVTQFRPVFEDRYDNLEKDLDPA